MNHTRQLARCGILAALSVAVLYLGSLLPGYAIVAAAAAGLLPAAAVLHGGAKRGAAAGLSVYAVSGVLGLLLLPEKAAAIWYLLVFGHYGVTKSLIERIGRLQLEWLLKVFFYTLAFLVLYFLLPTAFAALAALIPFGTVLVYLIGLAAFVLYDIGFSRLIGLYLRRIGRNIGRDKTS